MRGEGGAGLRLSRPSFGPLGCQAKRKPLRFQQPLPLPGRTQIPGLCSQTAASSSPAPRDLPLADPSPDTTRQLQTPREVGPLLFGQVPCRWGHVPHNAASVTVGPFWKVCPRIRHPSLLTGLQRKCSVGSAGGQDPRPRTGCDLPQAACL